jgi:hypothetical protein
MAVRMAGRGWAGGNRVWGEYGTAAAPAPCGRGGRFWRGHARSLVSPFAGAGRTAATKKQRAADKTGRDRKGKSAPLCRPTPEALWGCAVEGDAARERLSHLLHLCKQARKRRAALYLLLTKHVTRRCTRLSAA